jgi:hypothetical protein
VRQTPENNTIILKALFIKKAVIARYIRFTPVDYPMVVIVCGNLVKISSM